MSQRFNRANPDIRYSPRATATPVDYGDTPEQRAAKVATVRALTPVQISNNPVSPEHAEAQYRAFGTVAMPDDTRVNLVHSTFGKLAGHRNSDQIMRLIPQLPELMGTSVYAYPERDRYGRQNINAWHNYVAKATLDGKDYYVRFAIQEVKKEQVHKTVKKAAAAKKS